MYNEEIKKKYLNSEPNNQSMRDSIATTFEAIQPYEELYEKDISQLDVNQVIEIFNKICGVKYSSKGNRIDIIKRYIKWVSKYYGNINEDILNISRSDVDNLDKIKSQTVVNPTHLQNYLDLLFDSEDMDSPSCVYRTYFWLAYAGLFESEAMQIKSSNVKLNEARIIFNGRIYKLEPEAMPAVKRCVILKEFNIKKIEGCNTTFTRARAPGDYLLRLTSSYTEFPSSKTIRVEMSRKKKKLLSLGMISPSELTNLSLSYTRVWNSGIFYKAYNYEKASNRVYDFEGESVIYLANKGYDDDGSSEYRARQLKIINDLKHDYHNWKKAYNL